MSEDQGYSLPTSLLDEAIERAKEKYSIFLYRELLVELYAEFREQRRTLGFDASFAAILDERYTRANAQEQNLYDGIKGTLRFISNKLRARSKNPRKPQKRTHLERVMDHVVIDPNNLQSRAAF